jgi:hypothetical protein
MGKGEKPSPRYLEKWDIKNKKSIMRTLKKHTVFILSAPSVREYRKIKPAATLKF